jgi:TRAP-type mannitol/chloroaromatic compound transport system substrate-binding protein
LQRLVAEGAVVRPFSEDLLQRARDAARQLLSEEAAKDPAYRKVYEQWEKFRAGSFAWSGRNELAYASFAMRQ